MSYLVSHLSHNTMCTSRIKICSVTGTSWITDLQITCCAAYFSPSLPFHTVILFDHVYGRVYI